MRRTLLALLLACSCAAPAAAQTTMPCAPGGPLCRAWDATVTFVADGDTIEARVGGRLARVRITGIQAMEQSVYSHRASRRRGDCHALEATARLDSLIRGHRVRLLAQRASSRSGHRLRRSVWVRMDGAWVDAAAVLLREGHALWLPNGVEWAHDAEYHALALEAAAAGRNLWSTSYCSPGPDQDAPLSLSVNWDADGSDALDLDGEWVDLRNGGSRPVPVGSWWVRDSALRRAVLPAWAQIPPHGSIRVHVGSGIDTTSDLYWGLGEPAFENATGDGAYLFDPDGDLRAWEMYGP